MKILKFSDFIAFKVKWIVCATFLDRKIVVSINAVGNERKIGMEIWTYYCVRL